MEIIPCTLCFIMEGERVLLGMKKRGFGAGKWNGYGGKIHGGETSYDAARRETYEESGLIPSLEAAGNLAFVYPTRGVTHDVALFRATHYEGMLIETDEMRSAWFPVSDVPFDAMWVDDPLWLPQFLAGKHITAEFVFVDDETIDRATVSVM